MKEVVIKRVEHTYPCRLVQTAVKVTFPGMKKEVLVSFLGYKEPDLMHVMRCKGICSNDAISPVACAPTKRRLKKVAMRLKTQVSIQIKMLSKRINVGKFLSLKKNYALWFDNYLVPRR